MNLACHRICFSKAAFCEGQAIRFYGNSLSSHTNGELIWIASTVKA